MRAAALPRAAVLGAGMTAAVLTGCAVGTDDVPRASRRDPVPTVRAEAANARGTVAMRDLAFAPDRLSVKVGERVTWRNEEALDHNVVARRGARFKSRAFGRGGTYSFTPKRPGTIDYVCTLHPGMDGRLVVIGRVGS